MAPRTFNHLSLIPANAVLTKVDAVPTDAGVYLFFFAGGGGLLQATSYFELEGSRPPGVRGRPHLYTGAARNLRERLKQHMATDVTSSSLRRTLLAIELKRRAISRSQTPACRIKGERTLTAWLRENATIGIELAADPFERERELLQQYPSPFNIVYRREHPYARALSSWRQSAFPASKPECARMLRYV